MRHLPLSVLCLCTLVPAVTRAQGGPTMPPSLEGVLNAKDFEFKVKLIERTLMETGGNVAKASRILKLSKSCLHRLIRQGIVKRP